MYEHPEKHVDGDPFCCCLECMPRLSFVKENNVPTAIEKLIASRCKTCDTLEAEVKEYRSQAEKFPAGSNARAALDSVARVKEIRLVAVRKELEGFREALQADARQLDVPGTKRK